MFHVDPTSSSYCVRCGAPHDRFRDREHRRPASYCKKCHAHSMRVARVTGTWCRLEHLSQTDAGSSPPTVSDRGKEEVSSEQPLTCKCGHLPGYHSKYYWDNVQRRRAQAKERFVRHYWAQWLIRELRDALTADDVPTSTTGTFVRCGRRTGRAISTSSCSTARYVSGNTNPTPSGSIASSEALDRIRQTSA